MIETITRPLFKSDTGSFQELGHASSGMNIKQLSYLTVNSGQLRGGHYHTHKTEWFCCLHGRCQMELIDTLGRKNKIVLLLSDRERKFVKVEPYWLHTVKNSDSVVCELLVVVDEEYDFDNPDTFRGDE